MLSAGSEWMDQLSTDHVKLATALKDQAAIVMENPRHYSAEQYRLMQLDALRSTTVDFSSEFGLVRMLETILVSAISLVDAKGGEIGLYDQERHELVIVVSHNMGRDFAGTRMAMGEGAMGAVAEGLEPVIIDNYLAWDGRSAQYNGNQLRAVMASPLIMQDCLVGVIGVVDEDPERLFTPADLKLLNIFAYQAAVAVKNANLYKEAKAAAERRLTLHNASQEIIFASLNPEQIYTTIHKVAAYLMPVEAFVISLLEPESFELNAVYLVNKGEMESSRRIPTDRSLSGRVLSNGESLYIKNYDAENNIPWVLVGPHGHARSILAVPLRLGEQIIGMLSAQCYQANAYIREDLILLEILATYAAIALENTRIFRDIQLLALTDHLTQLYNRHGLAEIGGREIDRSRRFSRPLSAIMLDIDNFKPINDTYGHRVGDQILVGLARIYQGFVREFDLVVRYGGDEFLILLPEADLDEALQVANRLCCEVEKTTFQIGTRRIRVTISLGVVSLESDLDDLDSLIERADLALYAAKQAGRNRVVADRKLINE